MEVPKPDPNGMSHSGGTRKNPEGSERPSTSTQKANQEIIKKLKKSNELLLKKKIYSLHSMITPKEEEKPNTTTNKKTLQIRNESTPDLISEDSLDFNAFLSDEHPAFGAAYIDGDSDWDCNRENNFISFDSEWDSDFSDDLENSNAVVERKKKSSIMPDEDMSENFREHFLVTFQNLPRLSQISLDENQSRKSNTEINVLESDRLEKTTLQVSEQDNADNSNEDLITSNYDVNNNSKLDNFKSTPKLDTAIVDAKTKTIENENIESPVSNNTIPAGPKDEDLDQDEYRKRLP